MAKSKNHTNHNQNSKDHRNGIKKPKKKTQESLLGVCQKYRLHLKRCKKFSVSRRRALKRQEYRKLKKEVEEQQAGPMVV